MPSALARTFAGLRVPAFRTLWIGGGLASTGFFVSTVVHAVVAFELTGTNRAVGYVAFGRGIAQIVLAPLGGALADRLPKKLVLILGQSVSVLVFFGLALLHASGRLAVPHLAAATFAIGSTFAFLAPARQAYVVELVDEDQRGNAVALNQVALNASRVIGPALAGVLLAWSFSGPTGAFVVMGALYLVAVLIFTRLPRAAAQPKPRQSVRADIVEGVRYVGGHRRLRLLLGFFVLTILAGFGHVTVLPAFVEHALHRESGAISALLTASALGGLSASLAVAPLADSPRAQQLYVGAGFGFGVMLLLLSRTESFAMAAVAMFLVGMTTSTMMTLNGAVLLGAAEPRYVGRVMSLAMLAFGGFGVIGPAVGWLADAYGEPAMLAAMGALTLSVSLVFGWKLRERQR